MKVKRQNRVNAQAVTYSTKSASGSTAITLNDGLIDLITEYSDGKISYIDEE